VLEACIGNKIVAGFGAAGANAAPMPSIPEMGSVWASWGSTEAAILTGKIRRSRGLAEDDRRDQRRYRWLISNII
jgi:maltose-binding protein MalE